MFAASGGFLQVGWYSNTPVYCNLHYRPVF